MKNTFGNSISVSIFGESHGEMIGAQVDGLAPGIFVDTAYIDKKLSLRRPSDTISTARVEKDEYKIVSGVYNGYTTGTPIVILIPNENKKSSDYEALKSIPRPSHADYAAECKYHGYQDARGGGHFSGRITAALVAAGALIGAALEKQGIKIGTHISNLHGIADRPFASYEEDIAALSDKVFPTLSDAAEENMKNEIGKARERQDSVGGILESAVIGIPAGVGEPFFDSVESVISHILFSVPGIKGVEFGRGFGFADLFGSEANDAFGIENGRVITKTNNNGGINGGITNGMPITVRCAVKPTPSISIEQDSVNLKEMREEKITVLGRHDPAIIHRARAVVDAALAIAVADMLSARFGTDYLAK